MKGDNDCLEIMKGDHDCFDPMVQNIILPQIAPRLRAKENVMKGGNDCLEIMKGDHDCFDPMVHPNYYTTSNCLGSEQKKRYVVWKS